MEKKIFDHKRNIHVIVAYNIKKYRKLRKITQAKLSEMVDLSHEFIRRIESKNGQKSFSLETVFVRNGLPSLSVLQFKPSVDVEK